MKNRHLVDWAKWKLGITNIQHIKVFVTQQCNAKCVTCEVWKRKPINLSLKQANTIAKYFKIDRITISGGEALLWEHLVEFINKLQIKNIVLNTNGSLPEKLDKVLSHIPKINIAISLNGIGKKHNESRGFNCYSKVLKSIEVTKKHGFNCVVAFGLFKENMDEYEKVKQFAKENDLGMTLCYPVNLGRLKSKWQPSERLKEIYTERSLKDSKHGQWIWEYWMDHVFNNKPMKCTATYYKAVIQPTGYIEACAEWEGSIIGYVDDNIIWFKDSLKKVREDLKNFKCCYDGRNFCGSPFLERSPWLNIPGVVAWKIRQSL